MWGVFMQNYDYSPPLQGLTLAGNNAVEYAIQRVIRFLHACVFFVVTMMVVKFYRIVRGGQTLNPRKGDECVYYVVFEL